jgi:hypothetical protein
MTNNKYDLSLFQMAKQEWLHDFNIHTQLKTTMNFQDIW